MNLDSICGAPNQSLRFDSSTDSTAANVVQYDNGEIKTYA